MVDSSINPSRVAILVPVYNDWACASILIREVRRILSPRLATTFFLIDDGSTEDEDVKREILQTYHDVRIVTLKRNLGHQKAIAIGLCHINSDNVYDGVVVMDSDGEDRPEDIPLLLDTSISNKGRAIVFARRARRNEGLIFRILYRVYKAISVVLTGYTVNIGNFSFIPGKYLDRVCVISELWIHYPTSILKSRIPIARMSSDRGTRYAGTSKMNMTSLVTHGLGSMSVFSDVLGVRVIIAISLMIGVIGCVATLFSALIMLYPDIRSTEIYFVLGATIMLLAQFIVGSFAFTFTILNNRKSFEVIPLRDYRLFIQNDLD